MPAAPLRRVAVDAAGRAWGAQADRGITRFLSGLESRAARHDGRIHFPGTGRSVTPSELRSELRRSGLTLVKTSRLRPNQCAVLYPRADPNDISAEFAVMTCAVKLGDRVSIKTAAVHGGCDASRVGTQGPGGACEIGVARQQLTVDLGRGNSLRYNVSGPSANACGSLSTERVCGGVGASLASESIGVKDKDGNGLGMGVSVGVGAGGGAHYEDGVLSTRLKLKVLAGGEINVSLNLRQTQSHLVRGGATAFLFVRNAPRAGAALVGMAADTNRAFTDLSGAGARFAVRGGKMVFHGAKGVLGSTGKGMRVFGKGAAGAAKGAVGAAGKGVKSAGKGVKSIGKATGLF